MEKKYSKIYKKTHYYEKVYGININFVFDVKDYKKMCKKDFGYEHEEYEIESVNGDCISNFQTGDVAIGVFVEDHGVLVHELMHAFLFIAKIRHLNPDYNADNESSAYLYQHLFNVALERMNKHYGR